MNSFVLDEKLLTTDFESRFINNFDKRKFKGSKPAAIVECVLLSFEGGKHFLELLGQNCSDFRSKMDRT